MPIINSIIMNFGSFNELFFGTGILYFFIGEKSRRRWQGDKETGGQGDQETRGPEDGGGLY